MEAAVRSNPPRATARPPFEHPCGSSRIWFGQLRHEVHVSVPADVVIPASSDLPTTCRTRSTLDLVIDAVDGLGSGCPRKQPVVIAYETVHSNFSIITHVEMTQETPDFDIPSFALTDVRDD